jgi:hypothetical protein
VRKVIDVNTCIDPSAEDADEDRDLKQVPEAELAAGKEQTGQHQHAKYYPESLILRKPDVPRLDRPGDQHEQSE